MGKGDSPSAPNPYQVAQAQYEYGTGTANYNMGLNATDTVTPYGSTTWSVNPSGAPAAPSPNGATYSYAPGSVGGIQQTLGQEAGAGQPTSTTGQPTFNIGAHQNTTPAPGSSTAPTAGGVPGGLYNQAQTAENDAAAGAASYASGGGLPATEPLGSSGTGSGSGSSGPDLTPPQYTETQTLSPVEQQLFNETTGNQIGQASAAAGALPGAAKAAANVPTLDTDTQGPAYQTALAGNLAAIDPTINAQYEALDASLRNSGNGPGTPAYATAMGQFQAQETGTLDQAAGSAENTGIEAMGATNQALLQQNQTPIQDYLDLTGGSAASLPSSSDSASTQTPDIEQAFANQYQGQLNSYNASVGSSNAILGDLGSLASAAILASDERIKKDISDTGFKTPAGIPLREFRFKGEPPRTPKHLGVIAQEVEEHAPSAVYQTRPGAIRHVNYARLP